MSVVYKVIRIENNQPERMVELTDNQMDLIYSGLTSIAEDIQDENSPYYDKNDAVDFIVLLDRLFDLSNNS